MEDADTTPGDHDRSSQQTGGSGQPSADTGAEQGRRPIGTRSTLAATLGTVGSLLAATSTARATDTAPETGVGHERRLVLDRPIDVRDAVVAETDTLALCGSTAATAASAFWLATVDLGGGRPSVGQSGVGRTIETAGFDVARSITSAADGGYVVVGNTVTDRDSATAEPGHTPSDVAAVATDREGRVRSRTTVGESIVSCCNDVIRTEGGGYALVGGTIVDDSGTMDGWVVRLDDELRVEWTGTYSRSDGDSLTAIVERPTGGFLLVGNAAGGRNDAWILAIDDRGAVDWERSLGGPGYDRATAAVRSADGYAFVGQHATVGSSSDRDERGSKNVWIVTVSDDGEVRWDRAYDTPSRTLARDVVETNDGLAIVGDETRPTGRTRAFVATIDAAGEWQSRRAFEDGTSARVIVPTADRAGTDEVAIVGATFDGSDRRRPRPWIEIVDLDRQ